MLPVLTVTAFVATIPVPASPSGGHKVQPPSSSPVGSSNLAPMSVNVPPCSPANRISGNSCSNCCV